jgi:hypothetical protein
VREATPRRERHGKRVVYARNQAQSTAVPGTLQEGTADTVPPHNEKVNPPTGESWRASGGGKEAETPDTEGPIR